jgi:hypothetical protein
MRVGCIGSCTGVTERSQKGQEGSEPNQHAMFLRKVLRKDLRKDLHLQQLLNSSILLNTIKILRIILWNQVYFITSSNPQLQLLLLKLFPLTIKENWLFSNTPLVA